MIARGAILVPGFTSWASFQAVVTACSSHALPDLKQRQHSLRSARRSTASGRWRSASQGRRFRIEEVEPRALAEVPARDPELARRTARGLRLQADDHSQIVGCPPRVRARRPDVVDAAYGPQRAPIAEPGGRDPHRLTEAATVGKAARERPTACRALVSARLAPVRPALVTTLRSISWVRPLAPGLRSTIPSRSPGECRSRTWKPPSATPMRYSARLSDAALVALPVEMPLPAGKPRNGSDGTRTRDLRRDSRRS